MSHTYECGTWVIYRKTKYSQHPGPRAKQIHPAAHGDTYSYQVDKFWIVVSVEDQHVTVQTRGGKTHKLEITDPSLRAASWWERWWYRRRFVQIQQDASASDQG